MRLWTTILVTVACLCLLTVNANATVTNVQRTILFQGLSTDTKPTAASSTIGAKFYETDTTRTYTNDGSAWVLSDVGAGYLAGPDSTTAVGSSTAYYFAGFGGFTLIAVVSSNNTNIVVYPEVKTLGSGWVNANSNGDSTYIDTNGTFGWTFAGYADSVRATVSAGSGETAFKSVWRWKFGK